MIVLKTLWKRLVTLSNPIFAKKMQFCSKMSPKIALSGCIFNIHAYRNINVTCLYFRLLIGFADFSVETLCKDQVLYTYSLCPYQLNHSSRNVKGDVGKFLRTTPVLILAQFFFHFEIFNFLKIEFLELRTKFRLKCVL